MKEFGIIVQTEEFSEGDCICHINNWEAGLMFFFPASDYDVKNYSGKNGLYLKLIQTSKKAEKNGTTSLSSSQS